MKSCSRLTKTAVVLTTSSLLFLLIFLGLAGAHIAIGDGQAALAAAGFSVYAFELAVVLWLAVALRTGWRCCGRRLFRA